jgi:hypothetical protein
VGEIQSLGREVPADCKPVQLRLMDLCGLQRIVWLTRKGPWVYKGGHPGDQDGNPS